MAARIFHLTAKSKSFGMRLFLYGVLGPLVTLLPLMLVFAESLSSGLLLAAVALTALFLTMNYSTYSLVWVALLFAGGISCCSLETISTWSLWSAFTSGAIMTAFGFQELSEAGGETAPSQEVAPNDHRLVTVQKLLMLARQQLKKSNEAVAVERLTSERLKDRIKVLDHLFEAQNAQVAKLFEEVRLLERARTELSQLEIGDQALLKKACAFDQLQEQFHEKKEVLQAVRRERHLKELESEALEKQLEEKESPNLVDKLQKQLSNALGKLEKSLDQEKQLLELISLWSKT